MLGPGSFLEDHKRGERRFRVESLLYADGDHQIALVSDTAMDDKLVCAKTVAYDTDRLDDKKYVAMRRKALHTELGFLAGPLHLLPEPLDWIQLAQSESAMPLEPVLVYEYVHGSTLLELVEERYPEGLAPARALRITRELARFLVELHASGWVYRNLDPRHIIIAHDDVIHLVGCGNATPLGEKPNPTRAVLESPYVAPEIRNELSGKLLRAAADVYSLGALMSFMLTGEEPRERPENPLTRDAFERLSAVDPAGIALLVARCMQPMAKNRFGRVEKLLPYLVLDSLPTPNSDGFGLMQLPAPWSGAEPPSNRATRSKLSPGPLISVEPSTALEVAPPADQPPATVPKKRDRSTIGVVLFFLSAVVLGALSCLLSIFGIR